MTSKNRKYAAFDLETGADIPEDDDWQDHRPLGITCAALYAPELGEPITWYVSWSTCSSNEVSPL